jgi:chitinase
LIARGIPSKKLVIGKPVTQADAMNSGVIAIPDLANALNSGLQNIGWYAGAMFWQYSSDSNGYAVGNATAGLRSYCKANPNICV